MAITPPPTAPRGKPPTGSCSAEGAESLPAASREQFYVSVSRGRKSAKIYTDDKEALLERIHETSHRLSATELMAGEGTPWGKPWANTWVVDAHRNTANAAWTSAAVWRSRNVSHARSLRRSGSSSVPMKERSRVDQAWKSDNVDTSQDENTPRPWNGTHGKPCATLRLVFADGSRQGLSYSDFKGYQLRDDMLKHLLHHRYRRLRRAVSGGTC